MQTFPFSQDTSVKTEQWQNGLVLKVCLKYQEQVLWGTAEFIGERNLDWRRGDLLIHGVRELPTGAEVQLTLTMPRSQTTLSLEGKVIWSDTCTEGEGCLGIQVTGEPIAKVVLEHFMDLFPSL